MTKSWTYRFCIHTQMIEMIRTGQYFFTESKTERHWRLFLIEKMFSLFFLLALIRVFYIIWFMIKLNCQTLPMIDGDRQILSSKQLPTMLYYMVLYNHLVQSYRWTVTRTLSKNQPAYDMFSVGIVWLSGQCFAINIYSQIHWIILQNKVTPSINIQYLCRK